MTVVKTTLLIGLLAATVCSVSTANVNELELTNGYSVTWNVQGGSIEFTVEAATLGWVGFGFSSDGTMKDADLVIGGVSRNGTAYLYDRHATEEGFPPMDQQQDYELIDAKENATHTILKFRRPLSTGDKNDWQITKTPVYLIWSSQASDAQSSTNLTYHDNRGSSTKPINLLAGNIPLDSTTTVKKVQTSEHTTQHATTIQHTTTHKTTTEASKNHDSTGGDFMRTAWLDPDNLFLLSWNFDNDSITFQVEARTKGWAGIGFSPSGGMTGADIIVFWIDPATGQPKISDRHGTKNGFPPVDTQQDYQLISGGRNDSMLKVMFKRKRYTCDEQDMPLTTDTTRVIYAYNDELPTNAESFKKHQYRGTKSLNLFKEASDKFEITDDMKPVDIRAEDVPVPSEKVTTYWCKFLEIPEIPEERHIIRYEPLIEEVNRDIVHHILIFACNHDVSHLVGKGMDCFGNEDSHMTTMCQDGYLAGWAVGGEPNNFPPDIGVPIFGKFGPKYVMMEMHYENNKLEKGRIDSSGIRIWTTTKLRPVEAGQLMLGVPVTPSDHMIPPRQKEFTTYSYCSKECTEAMPEEGVTLFGGLLHTHLAGRKIRLLHYRNGKELPPILTDEHYDFNYQDYRPIATPVKIMPGDQMVLECVYETTDRDKQVYGGMSTHEEMCLAFIDFYPMTIRTFLCMSSPEKVAALGHLGLKVTYDNDSIPFVDEPEAKNMSLDQYLRKEFIYDWTQPKVDEYQKAVKDGDHNTFCVWRNRTEVVQNITGYRNFASSVQKGYPKFTSPYEDDSQCKPLPLSQAQHDGNNSASYMKANIAVICTLFVLLFKYY